MAESEAYELEHRGEVHRARDFDVLLKWAEDLRMSVSDRFRPAGSEDWTPVTQDPRLKALLSPENQWRVRMASGEFTAGSFEAVTRWAQEGRLSTDAVVEGPRTPPGGVLASALPALSVHLVEAATVNEKLPRIRIDGRVYPAPDVETISRWISESRVPLDAQISLEDGPWEPVGSCGLFDLEKWPQAALGDTDEPFETVAQPATAGDEHAPATVIPDAFPPETAAPPKGAEREENDYVEELPHHEEDMPEPFRVITASGGEHTFEDPAEIIGLLRKRRIMEYDEVRHSSLPEGSASVGALADLVRKSRKGKGPGWRITAFLLLAAAGVYLADTFGLIEVPWLP
ncbi:MAG: hypothetical protein R6V62_00925 [Candidatus Fermentibacteraceae bacterium]